MSELDELDICDQHTGRFSTTLGRMKSGHKHHVSKPPKLANLPLKHDVNIMNSPSSPDVSKFSFERPANAVTRSMTLPRGARRPSAERRVRRHNSELDGLITDEEGIVKLRRWIQGFIVVDFDLDEGPVINGVCPSFELPSSVWETIAFSAFPDSLQTDQGSQVFSFRIRDGSLSSSGQGYILGFCHFSQTKDVTSRRGYKQRSLVFLTYNQYPALFTAVISTVGALYASHGTPMLEAACQNISTWPEPCPGSTLELGFIGSVLQVELPRSDDDRQFTETSSFKEKYDPHVHILATSSPLSPPPIELFEATLTHLWSIWECLLLCNDAILVFGPSPAATSQAIWWFRDLLRPIPLASDIRPYFTLQDQDHPTLVNKLPPKAGLLLGATNPFFARSCAHWPHILSLGRHPPKSRHSLISVGTSAGPAPGWKTSHKRYISKDRDLLKQLEDACRGTQRSKMEASIALRRHFCSRTTAFLVPLNRYLNTLIPLPADLAGAKYSNRTPRLKPFSISDFFVSLKTHGSPLPFRSLSKRTEFYERWLKSPAFGLWLARQDEVVQRQLDNTNSSSR